MEHGAKVFFHLLVGEIDLSINSNVLWTFIATAALLVFALFASRKPELVPRRASQNVFEYLVEFVQKQILWPSGLEEKWDPFIFTIFIFILFNNLVGIVPGSTPTNGNINATAALAVLVFIVAVAVRFKKKGAFGFVKSLIPEGVSGPIIILLFPIELISLFIKPFSLAIRLFANMSGGHLLMLTIIGFTTLFKNIVVSIVSTGGGGAIVLFELFVAFIQAYVFAFLSATLLSEASAEAH